MYHQIGSRQVAIRFQRNNHIMINIIYSAVVLLIDCLCFLCVLYWRIVIIYYCIIYTSKSNTDSILYCYYYIYT